MCRGRLGELRVNACPHCGAPLGEGVWEEYQPPRGPVFKFFAVLIIVLVVLGSIAMAALTLKSQCAAGAPSNRAPAGPAATSSEV